MHFFTFLYITRRYNMLIVHTSYLQFYWNKQLLSAKIQKKQLFCGITIFLALIYYNSMMSMAKKFYVRYNFLIQSKSVIFYVPGRWLSFFSNLFSSISFYWFWALYWCRGAIWDLNRSYPVLLRIRIFNSLNLKLKSSAVANSSFKSTEQCDHLNSDVLFVLFNIWGSEIRSV